MKLPCKALFFFTLLLISFSTIAGVPIKFGKVSKEELGMKHYSADTSANAIILCDYGTSRFHYTEHDGFNVMFTRIIRIKIFSKDGYDWAKFEIPLYEKNDELGKLKACTILPDGTKIKLSNKDVFREKTNKYWETVKFEMPKVSEGVIIDIEYSINSDTWGVKDWYFQSEIPTLLSRYDVEIPEYFKYKQLQKGFVPLQHTSEMSSGSITFTTKERAEGLTGVNGPTEYHKIEFVQENFSFWSDSIPAFYTEAYMTCAKDYLTAINYELQSYQMPRQQIHNITGSWEAISKEMLKYEDFGVQMNRGGFLKSEIERIKADSLSDEESVVVLYTYIQNNMIWDGYNAVYSNSISSAWKDRSGTCSDINLMLVAGLRKMGFDANAVLVSTRSNGIIHPAQIMLDQFNYIVASVKLNDKNVLLDATDKNLPFGVLPKRCLNGKGRLIDSNGGYWVDIKPSSKLKKVYQLDCSVGSDGTVKGIVKENHIGYSAINKRKSLNYHNSVEDYFVDYNDNFLETELDLDTIINRNNLEKPMVVRYGFESENLVEQVGDLLLLNPFLLGNIDENPFKLEKREYPINYSYAQALTYSATFTIPDNYNVEELPKPSRMGLPNKSASFIYSVSKVGNKVIVVSRFNINKDVFLPDEYAGLKEFYNRVIESQSSQIVLKKI